MGAETGATAAQIEAMPAGLDSEEQLVWAVSRAVWRPYGGHTPGPRSIIALLRQSGVTIEMRRPDAVVLTPEQAGLFKRAATACDHMARVDTIETRAIYWRENAEQLWALAEVLNGNG